MKILSILFALQVFLVGCIYDPPTAKIEILNNSDSNVYVYETCSQDLPCAPAITPFLLDDSGTRIDNNGKPMNDTVYPNYRIAAHTKNAIYADGTSESPDIDCAAKTINLFFISETTMRSKRWAEICRDQSYIRKMRFSRSDLNAIKWRVVYPGLPAKSGSR